MLWAIGRLGARVPLDGPLNTVVPAETVARWLAALMSMRIESAEGPLAVMQLARRTDDRYRDLPEKMRRQAADWLRGLDAPRHLSNWFAMAARWTAMNRDWCSANRCRRDCASDDAAVLGGQAGTGTSTKRGRSP